MAGRNASGLSNTVSGINYPIGIQTFEKIRLGGYLYVDKTALIHKLVTTGDYVFLSRPRRFGKSLLLSTLEALFLGKRHLFKGLAIDDMDWDWVEYPVFHLDLNVANYMVDNALEMRLSEALGRWECDYGLENGPEDQPGIRFERIIRRAGESSGRKVIIMIDEYDKPLFGTISDPAKLERNREILQSFYSVLKSQDANIKFAILTGVTKMSKVSVFSGANNLMDISLDVEYNELCGLCDEEIDGSLRNGVEEYAAANDMDYDLARAELRKNYDGYHFADRGKDMYNPFSLLNALKFKRPGNYWFESDTPAFLVKLLKDQRYPLQRLEHERRSEDALKSSDIWKTDLVPIFYQTGYLTIKGFDSLFREYELDYPNEEVKKSFLEYLMPFYSPDVHNAGDLSDMVRAVLRGDSERFMGWLQTFFRDFPYDQLPDLEVHYQNVVYIIMKLMGFYVRTEYKTSDGRIDMVVKTPDYIYVIEFKLDLPAGRAIDQIESKGYADPFLYDGRKVIKIGASFDRATRALADWTVTEA